MHDGWSKLFSNFQPPIKAAPQQCLQKAHFKFSRVCTAACEDFPFGGTLGETFEAFAIESDLRLSRRKVRTTLEDLQQSAGQFALNCLRSALQLATCCMTVGRN